MRKITASILIAFIVAAALWGGATTSQAASPSQAATTYPLVDTNQGTCYDHQQAIPCPGEGTAYYGQDAQYAGAQPSYTDNGDGTVTDNVTGLMWSQTPDLNGDGTINAADKLGYADALAGAETFALAGYTDWRLPTIKELYSLMLFDGTDVSPCMMGGSCTGVPFIDTRYFAFAYGDTGAGERVIDSQFVSSTLYGGETMGGAQTVFGLNLADGRIKGYPTNKLFYVLHVRGNPAYGVNDLVDNGDGTITDRATGLMWMQSDSGSGMDWGDALAYCENLSYGGYTDWRLPDAKELQSIVDYTRAPAATSSAAIDPLFSATPITNEAGQPDYATYWTSTTHANSNGGGNSGVYIAFGQAMGYINKRRSWQLPDRARPAGGRRPHL